MLLNKEGSSSAPPTLLLIINLRVDLAAMVAALVVVDDAYESSLNSQIMNRSSDFNLVGNSLSYQTCLRCSMLVPPCC